MGCYLVFLRLYRYINNTTKYCNGLLVGCISFVLQLYLALCIGHWLNSIYCVQQYFIILYISSILHKAPSMYVGVVLHLNLMLKLSLLNHHRHINMCFLKQQTFLTQNAITIFKTSGKISFCVYCYMYIDTADLYLHLSYCGFYVKR